jgi:DNA invertase Pin-like site-specific DNA recombinase
MTWFLEDKSVHQFRLDEIVVYRRLSKAKKGKSKAETKTDAYGIKAQDTDVERLREHLGPGKVIATFTEIETGKSTDRDELKKAIALTRSRPKATLVIAKLDRLARNVHFTTGLMESRVRFICADDPTANTLTIQMKAVMAEDEARRISRRTKDALAEAREEGVKLGSARPGHWKGREGRRKAGAKLGNKNSAVARANKARDAYAFIIDKMQAMRVNNSLEQIAQELNGEGHTTTRQKPFTATAVFRIFELFDRQENAA